MIAVALSKRFLLQIPGHLFSFANLTRNPNKAETSRVMETPEYIINISSDEEDVDDNDLEIIEFRKQTQNLIDNPEQPQHHITKKLAEVQCPICFDEVTMATSTSCGHIFCLECIQQSISSSHARGQVRGKRGSGLCPLCRKNISFKDTIVLRMKLATTMGIPELPPIPAGEEEIIVKDIIDEVKEETEKTIEENLKDGKEDVEDKAMVNGNGAKEATGKKSIKKRKKSKLQLKSDTEDELEEYEDSDYKPNVRKPEFAATGHSKRTKKG